MSGVNWKGECNVITARTFTICMPAPTCIDAMSPCKKPTQPPSAKCTTVGWISDTCVVFAYTQVYRVENRCRSVS